MAKFKKAALFILLVGGILAATFAFSRCSEKTAFEQERTYVFSSAEFVFYNDYDKFLILDGKTEQEYINTYPGLSLRHYIFKTNNKCYAPQENTVEYSMYYEYREGKIKVYESKGGAKLMEFEVGGNEITTRLYLFEDFGSGKTYLQATFKLDY